MKHKEPKKCAPKRTRQQTAADMAYIEHEVVRGKTFKTIAEELSAMRTYKLSRQQVCYDYKRIAAIWRTEMVADLHEAKQKDLLGLAAQEAELWASWEKSKQEQTRHNAEKVSGGKGGEHNRASIVRESQCGDVAYMEALLKIRERRAKILGFDAPTRLANADGGNIAPVSLTSVVCYLPDNGRATDSPNPVQKPA